MKIKKKVYIDKNAEKELLRFSKDIQDGFYTYFKILRKEGKLDFPEARKVTGDLFEIRIKLKGEYRGFYAYVGETDIIILHVFRKKTQKTPLKNLKTAERRLKQYG